jgi:hypothetical protein
MKTLLNRLASRKFQVFVLASIFLILKIISEQTWLIIALTYISAEGIADAVARIRKFDK